MQYKATSPDDYISQIPEDRKAAMEKLRSILSKNLPEGFIENMSYGMISFSVPHSIYPAGYHCDSTIPLPFISIASQKNFIAFYHMGIYAKPELHDWFVAEFPKHVNTKLDMGKSCIRFKKPALIPFDLITELVQKVSVDEWIETYDTNFRK